MNRSAKWGLIVAVTLILLFALSWLIDQCPAGDDNAVRFGILTILPPLVAIALAFITKETILSLFLGVFVGEYMVCADGARLSLPWQIHGMRVLFSNVCLLEV